MNEIHELNGGNAGAARPGTAQDALARLQALLSCMGPLAIAVSGGVDSLTLSAVAHGTLGRNASMHHAVSPAVPAEATLRTQALAVRQGWRLDVFDAGEFADAAYRANPVNRCFFCKTNLYDALATRTQAQIVSGTNLDDLGDFRPGLQAARAHGVRHPFVECGIDKQTVRALASLLGLGDIAELPAAPCLSSRIETGIRIEAPVLAMVDAAERLLRARLSPSVVRCRVRGVAVVIELDEPTLSRLSAEIETELRTELARFVADAGLDRPIAFERYRTGSAFLRPG